MLRLQGSVFVILSRIGVSLSDQIVVYLKSDGRSGITFPSVLPHGMHDMRSITSALLETK
jgi:hypothetical protein